jgi:hypothetical protein
MVLLRRIDFLQEIFFQIEVLAERDYPEITAARGFSGEESVFGNRDSFKLKYCSGADCPETTPSGDELEDLISTISITNHQGGTVGATDRPTTPTG